MNFRTIAGSESQSSVKLLTATHLSGLVDKRHGVSAMVCFPSPPLSPPAAVIGFVLSSRRAAVTNLFKGHGDLFVDASATVEFQLGDDEKATVIISMT